MASLRHLHIYQRIRTRKNYYRCTHPECTHIQIKEMLDGKKATCPFCGNEYTITIRMLNTLRTLHCDDCTHSKKNELAKQQAKAAAPEVKSKILAKIFQGAESESSSGS